MKKIIFTIGALFITANIIQAQPEKISDALKFWNNGELDKAKGAIDIASENEQTANQAQTWYYRGFIYKEIYKKELTNPISPAREDAVMSFKKAILLDKENKYTKDCKVNVNFLATTFYNDAVRALNSRDHKTAIISYSKYKETTRIVDPLMDMDVKDIKFYNALGSLYTGIYETDKRANEAFFIKAKDAYEKVLNIDPLELSANYNIGILYYNKAVDIINGSDYDIDLVALDDIQDTSIVLFKNSLPYMETAYKLQPENENTLIGLSGIYFGLNELEKSNKIKEELNSIKKE